MPRKRTALGARTEKKIAALLQRGGTAESIAKQLRAAGVTDVSARTIGRRMRELRGEVAPKRVSAKAARSALYADPDAEPDSSAGDSPLPTTPESIPEGTDVSQIDRWLKRAEFVGKTAAARGDIAAIGQMGRLTSALLEARRKATPPEEPDPKDNPDMAAAAARARSLLHLYIDKALGKVGT